MPIPEVRIIKFPLFDTKNGQLCMLQTDNPPKEESVPFVIKRVLSITGMKDSDKRGGHTHHKTNQIVICTAGEFTMDLDDGKNKTSVVLNKPNEGLWLYPYVWHVMHSFAPKTTLLVLTDNEYDEKDYIRNYEDFIQYTKRPKR